MNRKLLKNITIKIINQKTRMLMKQGKVVTFSKNSNPSNKYNFWNNNYGMSNSWQKYKK